MDLRKLKHLNLSIFHWTLVLPPFHKGCLTFFKIYIQIITNLRQAWRNRGSVNLASEFFFVRSQLGGTKSEQRTVSLRSPDSWSVKLGQGKMGKKNLLDGTKGNHMLLFCPKKQTRCLWGRRREMVQRKKMLSTHARAITERPRHSNFAETMTFVRSNWGGLMKYLHKNQQNGPRGLVLTYTVYVALSTNSDHR
jgi:hypothetical protein